MEIIKELPTVDYILVPVGGGGLGDIAIRYGYYRYQSDIMIVTVILLIVIVQIFQSVGMLIANRLDRRKS